MANSIDPDQLRRYARPLRQVSPVIYQSAIRSGSYESVYRLMYKHRDRISIPIVKPLELTRGKNQEKFLSTTGQHSFGRSHPSTLPRREPVRIRKIVVGKISPKKYDEPIGPKDKHHYQRPVSMVCTVCGQHELTAWHDTHEKTYVISKLKVRYKRSAPGGLGSYGDSTPLLLFQVQRFNSSLRYAVPGENFP